MKSLLMTAAMVAVMAVPVFAADANKDPRDEGNRSDINRSATNGQDMNERDDVRDRNYQSNYRTDSSKDMKAGKMRGSRMSDPMMREHFNMMDANGDGMVSESEHEDFAERKFKDADMNNDDMLSMDEFRAMKMKDKGRYKR